jgi:2-polyprenyl-3-methyl-5-hydroxy-6-metoxy-1,4-benzoquinol methylase
LREKLTKFVNIFGLTAPDLSVRRRQAELMDDPSLDRARHVHALEALRRINGVSFAAARVWREVLLVGESRGGDGPIRVLDVACGGGDVLHAVGTRATAAGIEVELHGCDLSPVALDEARRRTPPGVSLHLFAHDVLEGGLPAEYDVVTSSLFLHHLDPEDAVGLLRTLSAATCARLLIQDLRRTGLGYFFAWVGLHTLTTSSVARTDGLLSVRAAFTIREVADLCAQAGLSGASIERVWPQRMAIRWAPA